MAKEEECVRCKHPRRSHSTVGCTAWIDPNTGKECPCKVKYMDKHMFR